MTENSEVLNRLSAVETELKSLRELVERLRNDLKRADKNAQDSVHNLTVRLDSALKEGVAEYKRLA
jgi:hypothetical protein